MSAVNMHGKIRTPFKMPVVKDDKTSHIHIEYEQVEFEIKECIVRLNGEVVNSEEYTGEIIRGFRMAYTEILQNQKLRNMLKTFFSGKIQSNFATYAAILYVSVCVVPSGLYEGSETTRGTSSGIA